MQESELVVAEATDNSQTTILPSNSSGSWLDQYQIGAGVNASTGEISLSALEKFGTQDKKNYHTIDQVNIIASKSDFSKQVSVSESTSFNYGGAGLSQSLDYTKNISYSEITTSYVAYVLLEEINYADVNNEDLKFTENAAQLLSAKDFDKFRKQYGDYFIKSFKKGAMFTATLVCKASNRSEMTDFNNKVSSSFQNLFSAKVESGFNETAKEMGISVERKIEMFGTSTPPNFDSIADAKAWFMENNTPVPMWASMTHYSQLDNNIPTSIDIPLDVFTKIKKLYANSIALESSFNNCPAPYQNRISPDFTSYKQELETTATTLATDTDRLDKLTTTQNDLANQLDHVNECYTLYCTTMAARASEPKKDKENDADHEHTWHYGNNSTTSNIDDVTIKSIEQSKKKSYDGPGWQRHTFNVLDDSTKFITGWEVISNRGKNGYWQKKETYVLGTGNMEIYTKSDYDRGTDYTTKCYYTDKSPYFDFTDEQ